MPVFFSPLIRPPIAVCWAAASALCLPSGRRPLPGILYSAMCCALIPLFFRYMPPSWLEDMGDDERLREYPRTPGPGCLCFTAAAFMLNVSMQTPDASIQILDARGFVLDPLKAVLLLSLAAADGAVLLLPDQLMLALCTLSIAERCAEAAALASGLAFPLSAADLFAGLAFPAATALCALLSDRLGKEAPMGFGDAKLMFTLCLVFGTEAALWALINGSLICGAFAAAALISGAKEKTDRLAFGPFIVLGIFLVLLQAV